MLILTRKIGESIKIGDDVTITVLEVKGNQVRLGTKAPGSMPVHRDEIYARIQAEKSDGQIRSGKRARSPFRQEKDKRQFQQPNGNVL